MDEYTRTQFKDPPKSAMAALVLVSFSFAIEGLLRVTGEKDYLLRFKSFTFQIESEITQSHPFLGARSQHLGGGR